MKNNKFLQSVRGTRTLCGDDLNKFLQIIKAATKIAKEFHFQGIELPILEHSEVFYKTLGDASDIVEKEMYNLVDKGNQNLTLRPEFTAPIMREFIESKSYKKNNPLKYFTYGPVFRYNRPQADRYRQFYQINFEHIGHLDEYFDAEIILIAISLLKSLQIKDFSLEINSLGCKESQNNYKNILFAYFQKYRNDLSSHNQKKLDMNPISILDSKEKSDQELILNAPKIEHSYSKSSIAYFETIKKYLDLLKIKFSVNPYLVRGLDYYSHIIFEIKSQSSSQQSTLIGGGRYDDLSLIMGHKSIPSVGCAGGIDRIANLMDLDKKNFDHDACQIIPISNKFNIDCIMLASQLRQHGIKVNMEFNCKIAKQIKNAVAAYIKFVIFVGEEEINTDFYKVKDLETHQEMNISSNEIRSIFGK